MRRAFGTTPPAFSQRRSDASMNGLAPSFVRPEFLARLTCAAAITSKGQARDRFTDENLSHFVAPSRMTDHAESGAKSGAAKARLCKRLKRLYFSK